MPIREYLSYYIKKEFMVDVNEMRSNILRIANTSFTPDWDTLQGYSEGDWEFEVELLNIFIEVCIFCFLFKVPY